MISNRISVILSDRNSALPNDEKLRFHQLLFISYQDGAPMVSVGGMILNNEDLVGLKKSTVYNLPYIRTGQEALDLQSPIVTTQELDMMNNYLPNYQSRFLRIKKLQFIPENEREKYIKTYRFYPNFVEIRD